MPGRIEIVDCGAPAFAALAERVLAVQVDDPLGPVTVAATSRRAAFDLRHRLARAARGERRGLVNVRFFALEELPLLLGGEVARSTGLCQATRAALGAAAREALRRRPGALAPVADHPATEAELVDAFLDLRQGDDAGRQRLAAGSRRARELAARYELMRAALRDCVYDDVDLVASAREALAADPGRAGLGALVVHLPETLRPVELELLRALAAALPVVVQLGRVSDAAANAPLAALRDQLVAHDFAPPPTPIAAVAGPGAADGPLAAAAVLVAPTPEAEVRAAVSFLRRRLTEGVPAERLGLCYATSRPYARLVRSALNETGLAANGPSPQLLAESPAARFLLALLELGSGSLSRQGVLAALDAAPVHGPDGRVLSATLFDRCTREAGILEGDAAHWRRRLDTLVRQIERNRARQEELAAGTDPGRAERRISVAGRLVAACAEIGAFVAAIEMRLAEGRRLSRWDDLSTWAAGLLEHYLAGAELDEAVLAALEDLATLEAIDPAPDLARFTAALRQSLERSAPPFGRLGAGIATGPLEMAAALDLDTIVVLGCSEANLPRRPAPSPLLRPAERQLAGLEVPSLAATVAQDRRRLAVALAAAGTGVLAYAETDGRSRRRAVASRFVPPEREAVRVAAPSVLGGIERVAGAPVDALSVGELECGLLLAGARRAEPLAEHFLVRRDERLAAGFAVIAGRNAFGRYRGRVPMSGPIEALAGAFSPTTLERYAGCPFSYFLTHELGCEVIEAPERRFDLDARLRGTMLHAVLEDFVTELRPGGQLEIGAAAPGSAERLAEIAERVFDHYERRGQTGRAVVFERRRRQMLRTLERERCRDAQARAASGAEPLALEHVFGAAGTPPVELDAGGARLAFRGMIDRVDRATDGSLNVIDYKSGQYGDFAGLAVDPVDRGRHLQLPLYGLAARAAYGDDATPTVRAAFRFLDHDGDRYPVVIDDAAVARLRHVLGVLVTSIESGCFPTRPGDVDRDTYANCRRCDFDPICAPDRARAWERARLAPELGAYAELVEGGDDA